MIESALELGADPLEFNRVVGFGQLGLSRSPEVCGGQATCDQGQHSQRQPLFEESGDDCGDQDTHSGDRQPGCGGRLRSSRDDAVVVFQCRGGPLEVVLLPGQFLMAFPFGVAFDPYPSECPQIRRDTFDLLGRGQCGELAGSGGELLIEPIGVLLPAGLELAELFDQPVTVDGQ